jgi:hypothetical protein
MVNVPHQNRLPFSLLLSFGKAKERRGTPLAEAKESGGTHVVPSIRENKRKKRGFV